MKKKFILYPIVGLLLYVVLSGYSEGPDHYANIDGTGATNPGGCSCHNVGVAATTTVVSFQLDSSGYAVTRYTGGHTYTITITGTNTSSTSLYWFGFQLCVIKTGTSGSGAVNEGSFTTTGLPTSTQYVAAGTDGVIGGAGLSVSMMEHSAAINVSSGGPFTETFTWTAPASGTGSVTIYGAVNIVNHDGAADAGDLWNNGNVTIFENVSPVTGTGTVCPGATLTLSDATTGGTWSSGTTSVATVAGGVVTGVSAGTAVITYNAGTSGSATTIVTVNTGPSAISGSLNVCQGATTSLTDGTGTWVSSSTSIATVGTSGTVGGISTGSGSPATAGITFTLASTGCTTTSIVTVNPLPAAITGTAIVCQGSTTPLTETTTGGTWSSSSTAIATVNSSGTVSGVLTGSASPATAVITYASAAGCTRAITVTVNPLPASITGTAQVCQGLTTSLADATTGGTWSSGGTAVATVTSGGGAVGGVVTGSGSPSTSVISYTAGGCTVTTTVTVNAATPAISGSTSICAGATTPLSDASTGGTWSSSSVSVASIGATSGSLTGGPNPGGTTFITYTSVLGCPTTTTVTVNPLPAAITGNSPVCQGATINLGDATTGGSWSSGSTAFATINAGGTITGTVTGLSGISTSVITYTVGGCNAATTVTVNGAPGAISGTLSVCSGASSLLSDASGTGSWSSANTAVATFGSTSGLLVAGAGPATTMITYTASTGCSTFVVVTVNPLPGPILGAFSICPGATTTLSDVITGGTWSSGNTTVATIGLSSGSLTGGASPGGTTTITYAINGCATGSTVTVNSSPPAITGNAAICVGANITLADVVTGGTWESNNTAVASIGISSGFVTGGITTGTTSITYTPPAGCPVAAIATVNALPPAIAGTLDLCAGTGTTLTDGTTGGTWSSANTAVATVVTGSGAVTAATGPGGTSAITYTSPTGCAAISTITVNPAPAVITGTLSVCSGSATALSDATTGGTWSSGTTSVATVLTGSGNVSGTGSGGTTTISYTLGTGCQAEVVVTVNALPAAIGGTATVCVGAATILTDVTTGGVWSSGNTSVATVAGGSVGGVSPNTATIAYTLPTGCAATKAVTVNPLPGTISGTLALCAGVPTTLTNATTGGTWSSSNTAVATIGLSSGSATGLTAGTTTIVYSIRGCTAAATVTVNPLGVITGPTSLCGGTTATLTDAATGGTWSSATTSIGTIISGSGLFSALTTGNTLITYTLSTGCAATSTISVVSTPGAITGVMNVCIGSSMPLADAGGGTWSSSNTAVATVNDTGLVFGVTSSTAVINYSLGTGCNASAVVTVNPLPATITGTLQACVGATRTLTDAGGTWSSSATGVATIDPSLGIVTGISASTSIISYTLPTGCARTAIMTINPLPSAITGSTTICAGGTTALVDTGGGTWTSSASSVATVSTGGLVTGIVLGTTTITYKLPTTGCATSAVVTVSSPPPALTGTAAVCVGAATTLVDAISGGVWVSGNTAVATVGSVSGSVSGVIAGTSNITYSLGGGCIVSKIVTVDALPAAIGGSSQGCAGALISLSDGTSGGTWSSSNTAIATILPGSSTATAVSTGVDTISYRITTTGCARLTTITVNPVPAAISGSTTICAGSTVTLTDIVTGGTWSSSAPLTASVGLTTGVATGTVPGVATITYRLLTGCLATSVVTVDALPPGISGIAVVCSGATTILTEVATGGTWSSSNTSIATVLPASGNVNSISPGLDTITYTTPPGCAAKITVTVNPSPAAISGATAICSGATALLTDVTTGGTWSSSAIGVASVGVITGTVTGGAVSGAATVAYRLASGCIATAIITVNPLPSIISGGPVVCTSATTAFIDATSSGIWSSSNTGVATVDGSGAVTGIIPGTAILSYTLGTGCASATDLTVNVTPPAITGTAVVCAGSAITLTDGITGGTWSSGTTSAATSTLTTGSITGVAAGTASIVYTVEGCGTATVVTVNPVPLAITGSAAFCAGATAVLADATTGGTWSCDETTIATVDGSGDIAGLSAGAATISYTIGTGCAAVAAETINPLPAAITGTATVCSGSTTLLSDGTTGGAWSSSSTGVATVVVGSGIATGVAAGTVNVTYTLPTGCIATSMLTVNTAPSPIGGTAIVCQGAAIVLTDGITGGTWLSYSTAVATITGTGDVMGVTAGTTGITYTLGSGCQASKIITVNPSPSAITGIFNVCEGLSIALGGPSGGTWSSGSTAIATVNGTGEVSAVSVGIATIAYTYATGCAATAAVTVNPLPSSITGATIVCVGGITDLADAATGGTWSSSDITIATVGATTGIVTGVSEATATITYTLPTGCFTTDTVTDDCNVGVKQIMNNNGNAAILPNPNKGDFTVTALFNSANDDVVFIEITDIAGQMLYRGVSTSKDGKINEQISIGDNVANGMYLLNLRSGSENVVLHFVIEK